MNTGNLIAIVGLGAILPDANDVAAFWQNVLAKRNSIGEVPADRWDVNLYYDSDPRAIDKTYSKIGAFVKDYRFDPLKNGIIIPPKVLEVMDGTQQWALAASQQALKDYGYPSRPLDQERVAVILGNANAGEKHYRSTFRILLPEYLEFMKSVPDFAALPESVRSALIEGVTQNVQSHFPSITEDTMPGELSNIIAGRVANVFNFSGPNYVTDAACASSIAALQGAIAGLQQHKFDAVLTGGVDRNMGPESYVKFCKIGALSADGSRPYAEGANGFVMGEGAVVFLLKRLEDAERDGDKVYAVIRGIGASSDGKGKGITAPNPLGQQRAIERAWRDAGVDPSLAGLVEGHGTSTKVGDLAEVGSLTTIFGGLGLKTGSIALGSVKSNIGHLKSAAGAVGLLKTILALHHQVLPPSANFVRPNPGIEFESIPFRVNTEPAEWKAAEGKLRFAGVSAFGFGGTNFHVVLEEYVPGLTAGSSVSVSNTQSRPMQESKTCAESTSAPVAQKMEKQSTLNRVDSAKIKEYVLSTVSEKTGYPTDMLDLDLDLEADLGIDTVKQAELFATIRTNYGIPRREDLRLSEYNTLARVIGFVEDALGSTSAAPVAETEKAASSAESAVVQANPTDGLKPYQGLLFVSAANPAALKSQLEQKLALLNAGSELPSRCPAPEELARPERIAIDYADAAELVKRIEKAVKALENEAPATWKALQAHGISRGSGKPGKVAFLFPGQGSQYVNMLLDLNASEPVVRETFAEADRVMEPILGRPLTSFIYTRGGEDEIKQAEQELKNTAITQPAMLTANVAVLRVLKKYGIEPDLVIGHSLGEYAALVAAGVLTFAEALEVVSARGREMTRIKVDDPGCMAAVSAPLAIVEETIRAIDGYVVIANINSPLQSVLGGTTAAIDEAIARFTAAGFQAVKIPVSHAFHTKIVAPASEPLREVIARMDIKAPRLPIVANVTGELYPTTREGILDILARQVASPVQFVKGMQTLYKEGARIFIEAGPKRVLNALASDNLKDCSDVTIIATNHPRKGGKASFNEALCAIYAAGIPLPASESTKPDLRVEESAIVDFSTDMDTVPHVEGRFTGSIVITGAGLGLPGRDHHVFDDSNVKSLLDGEMRIEPLPDETRQGMLDKHVTRLVKSEAGAVMEEITSVDQVLKLAGQGGEFDFVEEFGVPAERVDALDKATQLAMAAGIEALRDAGIPLVMHYRKTTRGTYLPDRWQLPESMQDETGVVFGSAFPGLNRMADEAERFYENKMLERQLLEVKATMDMVAALTPTGQTQLQNDLERRKIEIEAKIKENDYHLDRRFVFRVLSMGHSQFAEYIGARGPNTHVNTACATTTHAVGIAEDWIRSGRCRRVIVIAGDDVTNPTLSAWIGTGLLAGGAATSEGNLRMAALPFDKRRNGLIMGMGAAALVVESEDAARERGVRGIGELLATHIANSAYHGTRLDVDHVSMVMDRLLATAEERYGIQRNEIAPRTVFVSHETYTPARGGSASAEIHALRHCFREEANKVIIANTKGFTGHTMGVGVEDVIAVKALETGKVPPIANIGEGFEPDLELGDLNLSQGLMYHPQYALRLGAGFGSQVAMTLTRKIEGVGERIDRKVYNNWLSAVSGYEAADLEVVKRTLRVKAQGVPNREPAKSTWQYGTPPMLWASGRPAGNSSAVVMTHVEPVVVQPVKPLEAEPVVAPSVEKLAQPAGAEEIKALVLSMVSEKTGYPVEMLDLDLDLEADLGIDTVKQAELFAAIRTHYGIPRRENLILAEYNTLTKVIGFVQENTQTETIVAAGANQAVEPVASESVVTPVEPAPSAVSNASAESDEIKAFVLHLVGEKTGYPTEMLDLDLDLEADLGIDTVKQAELFAAVRTNYGIPRREDLILAEYNTLAKVISFVEDALAARSRAEAQSKTEVSVEAETVKEGSSAEEIHPLEPVARRIPVPVLTPCLDLCDATGVDLNGSRVMVVGDRGKVGAALAKKLKSLGADVLQSSTADLALKAAQWLNAGNVAGAYFLPALDDDPELTSASVEEWNEARRVRSESLYELARLLPASAFLVAGTRMGGYQGIQNGANPLGGLVSGFLKALHRERPGQLIKAVDFECAAPAGDIARGLIAETLNDAFSVEIGRADGVRYGFILQNDEQAPVDAALEDGSVIVVSGGTGGITGSVIRDMAARGKYSFYLLGRTNLDASIEDDLLKIKNDRSGFRNELKERMSSSGEKPTPVQLENKIAAIERAGETRKLLREVESAGGKAAYLQADITDPKSVFEAIDRVSQAEKRVDVLIHAAGMDHSRKIESKPADEFRQVIAVKADGFVHLFKALEKFDRLPSRVVFFSSVAGRFGNSGQTDYSAANDYLSKLAAWLPVKYPSLRAVSIDWGAWAEVGMASRGNIPALMARAGIEMLDPKQAAPCVMREIMRGESGEVVIAGNLGALASAEGADCGMNVARANEALLAGKPIHTMFSHLASYTREEGITLEAELDPAHLDYLRDHAINGIPVLPGVMGIEGFSVAAKHISSVLASGNLGFEVDRLENIQFMAPFKFYGNKPRTIAWKAIAYHKPGDLQVVVTLESDLVRHGGETQHMLHFSGLVHLAPNLPEVEMEANPPKWTKRKSVSSDEIYKMYFHGPSFQVLDAAQLSGKDKILGRFNKKLAGVPVDDPTLFSSPLLIELCFQTAGLWEAGSTGVLALPQSIGSLRIYPRPLNGVAIFAEVKPHLNDGHLSFDARVVDEKGNIFLELEDYQTSPLPYPAEKDLVEPFKILVDEGR